MRRKPLVSKGAKNMQEKLKKRLEELRNEFDIGQRQLAETENKATAIRQTLLRINGAIQVLEELLTESGGAAKIEDISEEAVGS
jgi:predicted ribosome quality control (RQC) complex YloA/Tae2 family protein